MRNPETEDSVAHWICAYYVSKDLFVFDFSNSKELHNETKKILQVLHLRILADRCRSIQFPEVQSQNNVVHSGVFAITSATSILYELKPNIIIYNIDLMRPHLIKMWKNDEIKHFSCVSKKAPSHELYHCVSHYNKGNTQKLVKRDLINANHILFFNKIIRNCSYYTSQNTVFLSKPNTVQEFLEIKNIYKFCLKNPHQE